jgi:hypothetical protein
MSLEPNAEQRELQAKRFLVNRLQETSTEKPVHLNRSADDTVRQLVELRSAPTLPHSWRPWRLGGSHTRVGRFGGQLRRLFLLLSDTV